MECSAQEGCRSPCIFSGRGSRWAFGQAGCARQGEPSLTEGAGLALAWVFIQVPFHPATSGQLPTANLVLGHMPKPFPWVGVLPENPGGRQLGTTWAHSCHHPCNRSWGLAWKHGGAPAGRRLRPDPCGLRALNTSRKAWLECRPWRRQSKL